MTKQYDNKNRGVMRTNERKEKDTQPDWRGDINIDGKEYWLSGWNAEHPNMGGQYFQLSVKAKDEAFKQAKQAVQETGRFQDESIPFMRLMDDQI